MKIDLTGQEKEALDFAFYSHLFRLSDDIKRREVLTFLQGSKNGADLGCGTGWFTACLAKSRFKVTAIDLSEKSLKTSNFLFKKENLKIPLLKSSVTKLPFPTSSLDFAILFEVLEHIPQPELALLEINRCIKNNGKLCLSIPNGWTFGLIYDRVLLRLFLKPYEKGNDNSVFSYSNTVFSAFKKIGITGDYEGYGHINQFSIFSIKRLISSAGFKILKIRNLEFLTPYYLTLMHGLLKQDRRCAGFFEKLDQKFVRYIPHFLAANWLFLCQKI